MMKELGKDEEDPIHNTSVSATEEPSEQGEDEKAVKGEVVDIHEHDISHGDLDNEEVADEHEDEELIDRKCKTSGGFTGRGVTLQMLVADSILQPKEGAMSIEYMGQKFIGDLLHDGKIRSAEVREVFSSPSAWALRCKRIVNPEQKYGCGWSSVRYCGRPLDVYKNQWMKKKRMEHVSESSSDAGFEQKLPVQSQEVSEESSARAVSKYESLGNRPTIQDSSLLVEGVSFSSIGKLQPFLVNLHTSALVVIDVHCSLTKSEVVGYLGGSWDVNTNVLTVTRAFPCLNRLADAAKGQAAEAAIAEDMEQQNCVLVGWYHSHPQAPPTPTVRDIDTQLDYQLKMKGSGDLGYRPCLGLICSPYYRPESAAPLVCPISGYWVAPPPESKPLELPRPMAMQHTVVFDPAIDKDVLRQIESCKGFYQDAPDAVSWEETWSDGVSLLEKLKASLSCKLRSDTDSVLLKLVDTLFGLGQTETTKGQNSADPDQADLPSEESEKVTSPAGSLNNTPLDA